ncbi:hypothetical protein D3X12_23985 [Pseudomonas protegens]|jgi:hypothetical protein|nr:hypothetical protein CEP86_20945 [Pseudomonas protegens]QEZ53493.1 hypothetical protein D3X12_23985 [Pseudomonas protegens]QEZ64784.1 hypothetical protein D4N37_19315 [Pseudomonas protegens]
MMQFIGKPLRMLYVHDIDVLVMITPGSFPAVFMHGSRGDTMLIGIFPGGIVNVTVPLALFDMT